MYTVEVFDIINTFKAWKVRKMALVVTKQTLCGIKVAFVFAG